ncbi:hypothetical protein [Labilibaculum antarcticum]|uniref:Peptidase S9 prolyl oligopeptidase catalytic domain-containing protein n=1 Tax=Labilibaculum antarcticum TaxID=1717717 RepID=A0A1Y1CEC3_9BACT|nr:hypothetical protein [Labilibaculum antarcticum]BAX78463.1 hypothetical protein ALGA_0068 [Labilibaculum antarcticum]
MTKQLFITLIIVFFTISCKTSSQEVELWNHIPNGTELPNSRGLEAEFLHETTNKTLYITSIEKLKYAWCTISTPENTWNLGKTQCIEAQFTNAGDVPVEIIFWVDANKGWDAVVAKAKLNVGESKTLSCNLRDTFPDGTRKINPNRINRIQFMLVKPQLDSRLVVSELKAVGSIDEWKTPIARLEVPDLEYTSPHEGKRVWYQPNSLKGSKKYTALYLPTDWKPNRKYPVIVEFPGNIYFTEHCYSSGRPEACTIGYGMSKGEGAIWISMPFVNDNSNDISEDGWENPDHTAKLSVETVTEIIQKYGGDKDKLILTGFSRGAIACGFIGLRNDAIASLWKGIHACQHYDGDGWQGAKMEDAKSRIKRFRGEYFHTDNSGEEPCKMLSEANISTQYVNSGLGAHASAMFLDDRTSTLELREWYQKLINPK